MLPKPLIGTGWRLVRFVSDFTPMVNMVVISLHMRIAGRVDGRFLV